MFNSQFTNSGGGTNRVFGKPCFCPLPKRGRFDESCENDEFTFRPLKTRASLLRPPKMTRMTKITQAKAWFRKKPGLFFLEKSLIMCSRVKKGGSITSSFTRESINRRERQCSSSVIPRFGPGLSFPILEALQLRAYRWFAHCDPIPLPPPSRASPNLNFRRRQLRPS